MLSAEDKKFMEWWEKNRNTEKKLMNQLLVGLPLGVVFGLPMFLSFIFRGWFSRMPYVSGTQFTLILIAILGVIVFYAIFRMKFKWEMNDQRYNELRQRIKDEATLPAE